MTYQEILENAKTCIGAYCKACTTCNGKACGNKIPGPGAKGVGDTAIRNYEKWQEIRVQMDTLCENKAVDTSLELFGKNFKYPFFAGPVGALNLHYGEKYNDVRYNEVLVSACAQAGIAALPVTEQTRLLWRQRPGRSGMPMGPVFPPSNHGILIP